MLYMEYVSGSKLKMAGKTSLQELWIPQNQTFEEVIEMENLQIKIPEELYNSLKALGYQDRDIYWEGSQIVILFWNS
mgnify:CR=1 FL=1